MYTCTCLGWYGLRIHETDTRHLSSSTCAGSEYLQVGRLFYQLTNDLHEPRRHTHPPSTIHAAFPLRPSIYLHAFH